MSLLDGRRFVLGGGCFWTAGQHCVHLGAVGPGDEKQLQQAAHGAGYHRLFVYYSGLVKNKIVTICIKNYALCYLRLKLEISTKLHL